MIYTRTKIILCGVLIMAASLNWGCSLNYKDDSSDKGKSVNAADYLPLVLNSSWTKTTGVTGSNSPWTFTDTIEDTIPSGSKCYFVYKRGNGGSELWRLDSNILYVSGYNGAGEKPLALNITADGAINSSSEIPYIVFGVEPGYKWPIDSGEDIINGAAVSWVMTGKYIGFEDVIGTAEAGPFPDCPKIEITNKITSTPSGKSQSIREEIRTLWLAIGIGIVRETLEIRVDKITQSTEVTSLLHWYIPKNTSTSSINGVVTDSNGAGVANVKFTLSRTDSISTDSITYSSQRGIYSFNGIGKGNYRIIPDLKGYIFDPDTLLVVVTGKSLTGQDFKALIPPKKFSVSGTVLTDKSEGLEGVILTLSNGQSDTSNADGQFLIPGVPEGNYSLTPYSDGYSFSPDSLKITVSGADLTGIAFTGTKGAFTVSGIITDEDNTPVAGVTVFLDDNRSYITGASGFYTFDRVSNGRHIIKPVLESWTFSPISVEINVSGADFAVNTIKGSSLKLYTISGTVTDNDGKPIAGVSVAVSDSVSTLTGADGKYELTLPDGSYILTPSLVNYVFEPASENVVIKGASVSGIDFTGRLSVITQFYSVSGYVRSGDNGIPGVTVEIAGVDTVMTGSDGSYLFSSVRAGSYTIRASLDGWSFSPDIINIQVNGDLENQNFSGIEILQGYAVRGKVTNKEGTGISGVNIACTGVKFATTSSDGSYSFFLVKSGSYTITPSFEGWTFEPDSINIIVNDADVNDVNFIGAAIDKYNISGMIMTKDGAGIEGISVSIGNGISVTSAQDGSYIFSGVPNGSYTITPSQSGWSFEPVNRTVKVENQDIRNADFTGSELIQTYGISGRITDNKGSGIGGVTVSLGNGSTYVTGSNGDYLFSGLSNGTYNISPVLDGWEFTPQSRQIAISGEDVTDVNFAGVSLDTPSYNVTGRAVDMNGDGMENVLINVSSSVAAKTVGPLPLVLFSVLTGKDGYFAIPKVPEGSYLVSASKINWQFLPTFASIIVEGYDVTDILFTGDYVPVFFSVSGTVYIDKTKLPVAGVSLTMFLNGIAQIVKSGEDGSFRFENIPNGSYFITPSLEGYSFIPDSTEVTVNNDDVKNIAISAGPGKYWVKGFIKDSGGNPIPEIEVAVRKSDGQYIGAAMTSQTGEFSFKFEAGNYILTPSSGDYIFSPDSLEIEVGIQHVGDLLFIGTLTYSVTGSINSPDGLSGIGGVTLSIYSLTGGGVIKSVETEISSTYEFIGIVNGTYIIKPSGASMTFSPDSLIVTVNGADVTGVNFTVSVPLHRISGRVISIYNTGIPDVNVFLSGPYQLSAKTDAGGNYIFEGVADGSWIVQPGSGNYTFSPVTANVTVKGENVTVPSFTGTTAVQKYSISGKVTDSGGQGIPDVVMSLTGGMTAVTNANGDFSFPPTAGGAYILTPSKANYNFSPPSRAISLNSNINNADFTGTSILSISGTVYTEGGLSGVTVSLSPGGATYITGSDGSYIFSGLAPGSYTVTPGKADYTFFPVYSAVELTTSNAQYVNFNASFVTYTTFSGTIRYYNQEPVTNHKVTISGGESFYDETYTDASGNYSFSVPGNNSFLIAPSPIEGLQISPQSYFRNTLDGNASNLNFTFTTTFKISGYIYYSSDVTTPPPVSGITVQLRNSKFELITSTTTNANGYYEFSGLSNGVTYFINPVDSASPPAYFGGESPSITISGQDVTNVNFTAYTQQVPNKVAGKQ